MWLYSMDPNKICVGTVFLYLSPYIDSYTLTRCDWLYFDQMWLEWIIGITKTGIFIYGGRTWKEPKPLGRNLWGSNPKRAETSGNRTHPRQGSRIPLSRCPGKVKSTSGIVQNKNVLTRRESQHMSAPLRKRTIPKYMWHILEIYCTYMYSLCQYMLAICICYIYVELGPTYMRHICKYMGSIWDW